jgi:hypothetical protein
VNGDGGRRHNYIDIECDPIRCDQFDAERPGVIRIVAIDRLSMRLMDDGDVGMKEIVQLRYSMSGGLVEA